MLYYVLFGVPDNLCILCNIWTVWVMLYSDCLTLCCNIAKFCMYSKFVAHNVLYYMMVLNNLLCFSSYCISFMYYSLCFICVKFNFYFAYFALHYYVLVVFIMFCNTIFFAFRYGAHQPCDRCDALDTLGWHRVVPGLALTYFGPLLEA